MIVAIGNPDGWDYNKMREEERRDPDGIVRLPSRSPYTDVIFCPFSSDFECHGGCPSMQERACINGIEGED